MAKGGVLHRLTPSWAHMPPDVFCTIHKQIQMDPVFEGHTWTSEDCGHIQ